MGLRKLCTVLATRGRTSLAQIGLANTRVPDLTLSRALSSGVVARSGRSHLPPTISRRAQLGAVDSSVAARRLSTKSSGGEIVLSSIAKAVSSSTSSGSSIAKAVSISTSSGSSIAKAVSSSTSSGSSIAKAVSSSTSCGYRLNILEPRVQANVFATRNLCTQAAKAASGSTLPRLLFPGHGGGRGPVRVLVLCETVAGRGGMCYFIFRDKEEFEQVDHGG